MLNEMEIVLRINQAQDRLDQINIEQSEIIASIFDDMQRLKNLWQWKPSPHQLEELDKGMEYIESFKPNE